MPNRRKRSLLAAVTLGLALVSLPTGWANAAETAACVWQKTAWELPAGTNAARVKGYDGSRYAVGDSGRRGEWGTISDPHGTLWDNGRVALRISGSTPHIRDVNAAGLIVGDDYINNRFVAVTISHDGRTTLLPSNPAWTSYSAWLVNNAGDIVGHASIGSTRKVVVWPASAPGTYRELPRPSVDLSLVDVDQQARIIANTSSADGGGFVWDTDGQWRVLAAQGGDDFGTPRAIRDGRIVGGLNNGAARAAEWNARGGLVRTIGGSTLHGLAIGGNGTVGGATYVSSSLRPVLWRNGTVVDPLSAVPAAFQIFGISDDEKTLVGHESSVPTQYRCS